MSFPYPSAFITTLLFSLLAWCNAAAGMDPIIDWAIEAELLSDGSLAVTERGSVITRWSTERQISRILPNKGSDDRQLIYANVRGYFKEKTSAAPSVVLAPLILEQQENHWQLLLNPKQPKLARARYHFELHYIVSKPVVPGPADHHTLSWPIGSWGAMLKVFPTAITLKLPDAISQTAALIPLALDGQPIGNGQPTNTILASPPLQQQASGLWQGNVLEGETVRLSWPAASAAGVLHLQEPSWQADLGDWANSPAVQAVLADIQQQWHSHPVFTYLSWVAAYLLALATLITLLNRLPLGRALAAEEANTTLSSAMASAIWHGWIGKRSHLAHVLTEHYRGHVTLSYKNRTWGLQLPNSSFVHPLKELNRQQLQTLQPQPAKTSEWQPHFSAYRQHNFILWLPALLAYCAIIFMMLLAGWGEDDWDAAAVLSGCYLWLVAMHYWFWSSLPMLLSQPQRPVILYVSIAIYMLILPPVVLGLPVLMSYEYLPWFSSICLALALFPITWLRPALVYRSRRGRWHRQQLAQLRQQLMNGQWQTDSPNRYEAGLPMAVALGVEQQWQQHCQPQGSAITAEQINELLNCLSRPSLGSQEFLLAFAGSYMGAEVTDSDGQIAAWRVNGRRLYRGTAYFRYRV